MSGKMHPLTSGDTFGKCWSIFFYWRDRNYIADKYVQNFPIAPHACRHTTLCSDYCVQFCQTIVYCCNI